MTTSLSFIRMLEICRSVGCWPFNDQSSRHIETSQLISRFQSGFYMMGTLIVKRLRSNSLLCSGELIWIDFFVCWVKTIGYFPL